MVVGGHDAFDYRELRIATQAVLRGAELIGTNRDASFPMPDGPWPASGAVLAAVETAAGRSADRTSASPRRRCTRRRSTGSAPAARSRSATGWRSTSPARAPRGIDAALVLTGGATREEAEAGGVPSTHVAASLAELVLGVVDH